MVQNNIIINAKKGNITIWQVITINRQDEGNITIWQEIMINKDDE